MYGIVMPYPSRPHVVATQSSYVLFSCQHRRKADVVVSMAISILEAVCHLPNHTDRLDACWQNGRRRRFNCEWRGGGPSWIIERGETHWSSGEILTHFMVLIIGSVHVCKYVGVTECAVRIHEHELVLRKPANTHEFRTLVTARQVFRVISRVVSHRLCTLHEAHPIQYHIRPSADADKDIDTRVCFA